MAQTGQPMQVTGQITFQNSPVGDVNVFIKGTSKGTKSDDAGEYKLDAVVGETIKISHVGFKEVEILLEDTSSVLNIALDDFVESLDEVVITAEVPVDEPTDLAEVMNVKLYTPFGIFNPASSRSAVHYLGPKELKMIANPDIEQMLKGRYAGFGSPGLYIVDDVEWKTAPVIPYSDIAHMYVTKGFVIIRTINAPEIIAQRRAKVIEQNKNQNYYQNDATALGTVNSTNQLRELKGVITFMDAPIADVNISVVGTSRGTQTDNRGRYKIEVSPGETLQFSHVSFKEIAVLIEDVTYQLDLEMIAIENELDEVVITVTNSKGEVLKRRQKAEQSFDTSRGNFDPKTAGYAVGYVDGEELSNMYGSLSEALKGKISGYQVAINGKAYMRGSGFSVQQDYPVAWEVDGVFTTDEPTYLDLTQIEAIYALKSLASTNKYGSLAAGGVIVIKTKYGGFGDKSAQQRESLEKLQNKDYYANDAQSLEGSILEPNQYVKTLESLKNKQNAVAYYNDSLQATLTNYADHLSIAQHFATYYKDPSLATDVLNALSKRFAKNPEIQKAIGYQFQALGLKREAVAIYKKVARLRPDYAQSYRDLANAHLENNQFVQAWRLYMSYMLMGNQADKEGIGRQIYSEMEYIFYNRNNQAAIKEKFVPLSEDINEFRKDVRLIFEWNTSEAEFDIEFVNPELRSYVFEHSLAKNQELIKDEKTKGYSSKEFFVDDLGDGEWLVNFTYRGNKKPEPTYVKLTIYYNWGKSFMTQEVRLYRLKDERNKLQLLRLNKQDLEAAN
ncbi:MAG: carboxypeptidase-like regulatory domain-containing protein [Gilvibacter sp.]